METYLAIRCGDRICEDGISNVFWGFLILMALVVCCLLAWKAIEKLSNGRNFDNATVEDGRIGGPPGAQGPENL